MALLYDSFAFMFLIMQFYSYRATAYDWITVISPVMAINFGLILNKTNTFANAFYYFAANINFICQAGKLFFAFSLMNYILIHNN